MRSLLHGAVGAVLTLTVVLSCSDDSPPGVDAATNCEPPLAGRIVMLEGLPQSGNGIISAIASCPAGALRLGGGCELDGQNAIQLRLVQSGRRSDLPGNYGCVWDNPDMVQITGKAWVTCLMPAQ